MNFNELISISATFGADEDVPCLVAEAVCPRPLTDSASTGRPRHGGIFAPNPRSGVRRRPRSFESRTGCEAPSVRPGGTWPGPEGCRSVRSLKIVAADTGPAAAPERRIRECYRKPSGAFCAVGTARSVRDLCGYTWQISAAACSSMSWMSWRVCAGGRCVRCAPSSPMMVTMSALGGKCALGSCLIGDGRTTEPWNCRTFGPWHSPPCGMCKSSVVDLGG